MRLAPILTSLTVFGALLALPGGAALAAAKTPPACSAITFRAVAPGTADGEQTAGLYKSRFGRIEVMATVKNGAATNYYVNVSGKPLKELSGELPASVAACAKAKRLAAPTSAAEHCTGDKLRVLIEHSGEQRYMLLYALHGREWHYCNAGGA
jgi:hypothetical protein